MHRAIPRLAPFAQVPRGAMARFVVSFLAACLLVPLVPGTAGAACAVREAATVPLDIVAGTIFVRPDVNGLPANFVLDTGAQRSMVTEEAVKRLGLARDQWVGTTMRGIGGIERRPNADPRSFTLAGVDLVRPILSHDTSLTVGSLARTEAGGEMIEGLLGRDFLSVFDLDLDLPRHRLTLYRVSGCAGRFLPWHGRYDAIPANMPAGKAIVLPTTLDGTRLSALLDSGADSSLLAAPGMYRLGVSEARLSADRIEQVAGLGQRLVEMRRHTFESLRVGDETIANPVIWVAPIRLVPITDMLLGADWLAGRRVWISFATGQVFTATAGE